MDKPQVHRRVNVKTSATGVKYAEATFTIDQDDEKTPEEEQEYRLRALSFFASVDEMWPPPMPVTKK